MQGSASGGAHGGPGRLPVTRLVRKYCYPSSDGEGSSDDDSEYTESDEPARPSMRSVPMTKEDEGLHASDGIGDIAPAPSVNCQSLFLAVVAPPLPSTPVSMRSESPGYPRPDTTEACS
jgi:hypothetical protein